MIKLLIFKHTLTHDIDKTFNFTVDGGWTPWIPGQCSKTCGTGTEVMTRTCNNPPPSSGGRPCVGSFEKRVICQIKSCTLSKFYSLLRIGLRMTATDMPLSKILPVYSLLDM